MEGGTSRPVLEAGHTDAARPQCGHACFDHSRGCREVVLLNEARIPPPRRKGFPEGAGQASG